MGTRGLWGFHLDGQLSVTYNHFDSYPDGLGVQLADFLQGQDLDGLKGVVRTLTLVNEDEKPTPAQVKDLTQYGVTHLGGVQVASGTLEDWYNLLRDTQGNPVATLASGYMIDSRTFGYDSLFCEWGYVIDFDGDAFTIYEGFQHHGTSRGFWADGDVGEPFPGAGNSYGPIAPVASFALGELVERGGEAIVDWEAARSEAEESAAANS